jgi:hypothetical protein
MIGTLILTATLFVLEGGSRIEGEVVGRQNGRLLIRTSNGLVYSVEERSIVSESSSAAIPPRKPASPGVPKDAKSILSSQRIRVSAKEKQRLLTELSKNRRGKPAPLQSWEKKKPAAVESSLEVTERSDESWWREQSRQKEEAVRRAEEQLELYTRREREIEDTVRMMLLSGVHPNSLGYQMNHLSDMRTMRDQARLEIERAKRELATFRDDARKEGILPGWLR